MSREKFEEIPQIAELLKNSVQWSEKFKIYHVKVSDNFDAICDVRYVNGAWFAWQEQQKVIDATLQELSGAIRFIEEDAIDDSEFIKGAVLRSYARLQGKLRGEP